MISSTASGTHLTTIAVIGAGFSGTLLTLHLLRHCPVSTRVVLVERGGQFGRGQAYSTGNNSHLLNVPAARMSALQDAPSNFVDWLRARDSGRRDGVCASPATFAPRGLYGSYLRELLKEEVRRERSRRLLLVRGEVVGLDRSGPKLRLFLDRGREIEADFAVLAVGSFPPAPPHVAQTEFYDTPLYRPDPWAADALTDLQPDAPVLLIGTGLTMVDMVISLLDQGHKGRIHALSRRGLLPRRHAAAAPLDRDVNTELPCRVTVLLRYLRREAARSLSEGATWQQVVDGLRPFTQELWQCMPQAERARFLRHVRPWWEVHRHRMAPQVADRIEAAQASGQLQVHAGRLQEFDADAQGVAVRYRKRGCGAECKLDVARVVNCSGPGADYQRVAQPLIRDLLARGIARPDPFRLGLDVTNTGALLNSEGGVSRRIFAIGPLTKGAFWEITAVPDIRRQCEMTASRIANLTALTVTNTAPQPPSETAPTGVVALDV